MSDERDTTSLSTGGGIGVIRAVVGALGEPSEQSLTFNRGFVDSETGFVLRDIDPKFSEEEAAARFVPTSIAVAKNGAGLEAAVLHDELAGFLDFTTPKSLTLEGLLEQLSQLLLQPSRTPGEPCLAPAPLLKDLLDIALGRLKGVLGGVLRDVVGTVEDLILPGFATEGELEHFIQSILDDPVTAALNLVLGQQNQIDCLVEGGIEAGENVIQAGIRKLEEAIGGFLS